MPALDQAKPETTDTLPRHRAGKERRLPAFLTRKERWGLSWLGWLVVLLLLLAGATTFLLGVFPFLAVTQRAPTDILVVEGWVASYVVQAAAKEFSDGHYKIVYTTGGPIRGMGGYTNDYNTSASVAAGSLRKAGVPSEQVQMVPSHVMRQDRTYSSAVALRDWFVAHDLHPTAINVLTEGPHARRTSLLYRKAFGNKVAVGIISVPSPDYDAKHWWRYSESVRDIIDEAPAYLYARLVFWPSE